MLFAQEGAARLDTLARVVELPRDDGVGDRLEDGAVADREERLDLAALSSQPVTRNKVSSPPSAAIRKEDVHRASAWPQSAC